VPFTYASHQAPVLAIKLRWPAAVDGTAMVMGSMAPDWAYALHGTGLAFDAHGGWGLVLFCVPAAVVAATILRRVAPVLFTYLPSPPALPLRQLRVLGGRRPRLPVSLASGLVGALTHVAWDVFTHDGDWGPRHIAWLRSTAVEVAGHSLSWAKVLQYASHVGGALVSVYLLSRILRSGSLLRWYGVAAVDDAPAPEGTVRFWTVTAAGLLAGTAWSAMGEPGLPGQIIRVSLGVAVGLVAASVACAREPRTAAAPRRTT
jgi:hypothetical protein